MSLDDSIHRKVPIRDRIDRSSNGYQENFSIRKSSVNHSDRQRERIEIETVANSKIRYNIRRTNFTPFVFYNNFNKLIARLHNNCFLHIC